MSRENHSLCYRYPLKYPPCYNPDSCVEPDVNKCHCNYDHCRPKDCLPKCGNNVQVSDFSSESLEYTRLNINSFPRKARDRIRSRIDSSSDVTNRKI